MNNFAYSIDTGLYNYEVVDDNKIRVYYTIGNVEKTFYIPLAVPESRYKIFYDQMDSKAQKKLDNAYRRLNIEKLRATDDKAALLAKYPDLENENVYVLTEATKDYQREEIEQLYAAVGYTSDDYYEDLERYNLDTSKDTPIFNVVLEYELTDDGFKVSVPLAEVESKTKYPIVELRVIPFFGAGSTEDEGFIFVPEGSGAVINFNNGKTTQSYYKSDVYGYDFAVSRKAVIDETRANYPVFGICKNSASFLCILEEGSSYAKIEADISGRSHSYNYASASYVMLHDEIMDISSKSDKTVRRFETDLPDETITQKYVLIDSDKYVDMATTYRSYLLEKYPNLAKTTEEGVPMVVEVINSIDKVQQVMGVPKTVPVSVTTYSETEDIVADLLEAGINNFKLKLNGWFNGGVQHDNPAKVKLISKLGGKKGFKGLTNYLADNNIDLYVEANFQYIYNNSTFDGFIGIRDSAKYVSRKLIELYPYSYVWYGKDESEDMYYLAKPAYYLKNLDAFAAKIGKLNVKNISFTNIGSSLSADYNPKDSTSREAAMKLQVAKMAELSEKGYGMMINTGNIYAVPYADFITDLNLETKGYNIIDEEVPFIEIVLHGIIPYSGTAINLASDYEHNLLRTVETGAGLYFVVMNEDSDILQETKYTKYFSIEYDKWSDTIKELYKRVEEDFGHLNNQYIKNHKKLAENVYMTVYEDGTKVIVNYGESAYNHKGTEVPAKDYIVLGGKQ